LDYVRLQTPFDSLSDYYLGDFKKALLHNVPLFYDEEEQGYCHLHQLITPNIQSPIFSPLYSMLIRSAPANAQDVDDSVLTALTKELKAARGIYQPTEFVWTSLFEYPKSRGSSISEHIDLGSRLETHHRIWWSLTKAKSSLQELHIYPQTSQKTMGRQTREDAQPFEEYTNTDTDGICANDLLRIYHKTGIRVGGETELRSAWKFNDLKPRIYYARGGRDYFASCHVQPIFNILLDSLPITHRRQRFLHESLDIAGQTVFIYDYASFTSHLHALRGFLLSLAEFLADTSVHILDVHQGWVEINCRDVLLEYAEVTTLDSSFSVERFGQLFGPDGISHHNTGMLGIPGNIVASTLLHGIHLALILGSFCCKCVGDDAIGVSFRLTIDLVEGISQLAPISVDKFEEWDQDVRESHVWKYLKRPLYRIADRLRSGFIIDIPPFPVLWNLPNQRGRVATRLPIPDAQKRSRNMLLALYLKVAASTYTPSREEEQLLSEITWETSRRLKLDGSHGIFPSDFSLVKDGYRTLLEQYQNEVVCLPVEDVQSTSLDIDGPVCQSSPELGILRALGYVELEPLTSRFLVRDDPSRFLRFLYRDFRPVYHVKILETPLPSFVSQSTKSMIGMYWD